MQPQPDFYSDDVEVPCDQSILVLQLQMRSVKQLEGRRDVDRVDEWTGQLVTTPLKHFRSHMPDRT